MANFIGLVYATLKAEGIDTNGMSTDEAVAKYNELQKASGGKSGEKEGTPAENRKMNEGIKSNLKQGNVYILGSDSTPIMIDKKTEAGIYYSTMKYTGKGDYNGYVPTSKPMFVKNEDIEKELWKQPTTRVGTRYKTLNSRVRTRIKP